MQNPFPQKINCTPPNLSHVQCFQLKSVPLRVKLPPCQDLDPPLKHHCTKHNTLCATAAPAPLPRTISQPRHTCCLLLVKLRCAAHAHTKSPRCATVQRPRPCVSATFRHVTWEAASCWTTARRRAGRCGDCCPSPAVARASSSELCTSLQRQNALHDMAVEESEGNWDVPWRIAMR